MGAQGWTAGLRDGIHRGGQSQREGKDEWEELQMFSVHNENRKGD